MSTTIHLWFTLSSLTRRRRWQARWQVLVSQAAAIHYGADINHKLYRPAVPKFVGRFYDHDYDTSVLKILILGKILGWGT